MATNRRASYDYNIQETFQAGLVLEGWEVKAIRAGKAELTGGFIHARDGELWLTGCRIDALKEHVGMFIGNSFKTKYNPGAHRSRKLLLKKKEIKRIMGQITAAGRTAIPLRIEMEGRYFKLAIAIATGKKNYDKREDAKNKSVDRELKRVVKSQKMKDM